MNPSWSPFASNSDNKKICERLTSGVVIKFITANGRSYIRMNKECLTLSYQTSRIRFVRDAKVYFIIDSFANTVLSIIDFFINNKSVETN